MKVKILRSRAPLRIDLAGGTLDIPPVAESMKGGGVTLNAAISMYAYTSVYPIKKGIILQSSDYGMTVKLKDSNSIKYDKRLDLLKAMVKVLGLKRAVKMITKVDSPPQSRLGTSSALAVAFIGALKTLKNEKMNKAKIADLANFVESGEFKICQGKQDQYASALGGFNFLNFRKGKRGIDVNVSKLKLLRESLLEMETSLFLCYIGRSVVSGDLNQKMIDRYLAGEKKVVRSFNNIRKVTIEMNKALKKGDLKDFAHLLNEERLNRKNLDPSIVDPKSQRFINVALKNGALAAKVLGAGGGGCILFYSRENKEHMVKKALEKIGGKIIEFTFDFDGLQTWNIKL